MQTAFGIDFGTTNTRVSYFDGERIRMVPFSTKEQGQTYQLPSAISYRDGKPVACGAAAQLQTKGTLFPDPLKWLLGPGEPVEVAGGTRDRVAVVSDFLERLRDMVKVSLPRAPLDRAAVTIPVHYPPRARAQLALAFSRAGIEVTHFFFEPIAAIYAGLLEEQAAGVAAVFDWGGGSLDIATVQIRDGVALTRQIDGWHRGGCHFDRLIAQQAVNDLFGRHPEVTSGYTVDMVLDQMKSGRDLRLAVEQAKIQLSSDPEVAVKFLGFIRSANINYRLSRGEFAELIAPDVTGGIARLDRALAASGVTRRTLARLFLSGGTCNVPLIRDRLMSEIAGHKVAGALRLPERLRDSRFPGGLDDIGNATAIGAALLAVYGSEPVFASSIGVRLAGDGDAFYPVFPANEAIDFQKTRTRQFFVSDASSGVARLLICDQDDPVTQPSGRLLRVIAVPIETSENWVDVRFKLDRHLTLRVEAAGRSNIKTDTFGEVTQWPGEPAWIQTLNLGFRVPTQALAPA